MQPDVWIAPVEGSFDSKKVADEITTPSVYLAKKAVPNSGFPSRPPDDRRMSAACADNIVLHCRDAESD